MKEISSNISSLRQVPSGLESRSPASQKDVTDSVFKGQLDALQNAKPSPSIPTGASPLKFSNHAIDRMQARGIRFSPEEMTKIEGAVTKAAGKGAKDTLLLTDNNALIVSVKDNTVVTVMDKAGLKDNVFTNIDSTVVI